MSTRAAITGLCAILVLGLFASPGFAQKGTRASPPVQVSGFKYKYIASRRIHMNLCASKACSPGSKVSYIIYAPNPNPQFF